MFKWFLAGMIAVAAATMNSAFADEFATKDQPKFQGIEPRMVYGKIVYDFSFVGGGPRAQKASAQDFLSSVINSKFSNREGSYIVTLDVFLGDQRIASEPILTATWKSRRFFFVTTSTKTDLVVDNNGIILDNVVIDNENNQMKFAITVYRSENSTFDLSLFQQLSELSKNSYVSRLSPGLTVANEIYQPFAQILSGLLSKYDEARLVESTIGMFTLLDEGFGNVLRYSNNRFTLNVYLKTENSQLSGSFSAGKFRITNHELVLSSVKSGVGAARAPVLEIVSAGGGNIDQQLSTFARAVSSGTPLSGNYRQNIGGSCRALKTKFNSLVTTRDASLVYWAFLTNFAEELRRYDDGQICANDTLLASMREVGLDFDPQKLSRAQ